jgi:hypothetical protein
MFSFQGFNYYGNLSTTMGELDYQLLYGDVSLKDDTPYFYDMFYDFGYSMSGNSHSLFHLNTVEADARSFHGGQVIWNTRLPGLKFGFTQYKVKADAQANIQFSPTTYPLNNGLSNTSFTADFPKIRVLSANWQKNKLAFTYERMDLHANAMFFANGALTSQMHDIKHLYSYYYQTNWTMNEKQQMAFTYAKTVDDTDIPYIPANYQKDRSISFRHDISDNWIAKIEYHDMEGTSRVRLSDNKNNTVMLIPVT